jgi:Na+-driven multidrug efflux pump
VLLNVVFGAAYSLVALVFLDKILYCMGASPAMLAPARQFLSIILIFNTLTEVYLGLNHLIRASGFPRKAMGNMLLTVAINLALCPLFIFGFGWGIRGAAIATICAQATGVALTLAHFCSPNDPFSQGLLPAALAHDPRHSFHRHGKLRHAVLRQLRQRLLQLRAVALRW